MAGGGSEMCEVDLGRRSWVVEVGMGKVTDSPPGMLRPGHSGTTGGFRRARGERNLKRPCGAGPLRKIGEGSRVWDGWAGV